MKTSLSTNRARYYELLFKYEQRKEEVKNKFILLNGKWKGTTEYQDRIKKIDIRIKYYRKQIAAIDIITNQMTAICNAVIIYAGRSPRHIGRNHVRNPDYDMIRLAKGLFAKWGLEHSISSKNLSQFMGSPDTKHAAKLRTRFDNDRKTNVDMDQKWQMFKKYTTQLTQGSNFIDKRKATS